MTLETIEYNYGSAQFCAERSDREALLWSVLKWLNLGTIHENRLHDAWHTVCGLCHRHADGLFTACVKCPLALAGYKCVIRGTTQERTLWLDASDAFDSWHHMRTQKNLAEFRRQARKFTMILARIYNEIYPDQKIRIDFAGTKIVEV